MMQSFAQTAYPVAAGLFAACSVVQVFLAGLGVFESPSAFVTHRGFGYLFGWLTLVMLIVALAGRMPRRFVGISVLLLVLFALQSVFVALRDDLPAIAAFHPLNGFFILGAGAVATRASWLYRRAATGAVAQPGGGATIALPGETA